MKVTREEYLKALIQAEYPSIRAFSEHIKMPYSTLTSILKNVGGASVTNLRKITMALGITLDDLADYGANGYVNALIYNNSELAPSQILLRAQNELPEEKFRELEDMAEFFLKRHEENK